MSYAERYVVELEDNTFALWGKYIEEEDLSILAMSNFCDATLFRKERAIVKVDEINNGVWNVLDGKKRAIGIRKIEMKMI